MFLNEQWFWYSARTPFGGRTNLYSFTWAYNKWFVLTFVILPIVLWADLQVVITLSLYYVNESIDILTCSCFPTCFSFLMLTMHLFVVIPSPAPHVVVCLPISKGNKLFIVYCCVMAAELSECIANKRTLAKCTHSRLSDVLLLSLYKGLHQCMFAQLALEEFHHGPTFDIIPLFREAKLDASYPHNVSRWFVYFKVGKKTFAHFLRFRRCDILRCIILFVDF